MKFFSGIRSPNGNGKKSASALFKQKLSGKPVAEPTADEKYKQMIDGRKAKMLADYASGVKKGFKLPGTKDNDATPKELSKNAMKMIEELAMQKAKKDMKAQKKKEYLAVRKVKSEKNAEIAKKNALLFMQQKQADLLLQQQLQEAQAKQQSAASYFFGQTDEKSGW
jgi:hypothetical protein